LNFTTCYKNRLPAFINRLQVLICIGFFSAPALAQENQVLDELLSAVEKTSAYDKTKIERIEDLRSQLELGQKDFLSRYSLYRDLLQEYKVFNQDSAFAYGLRTREMAEQLDSIPLIADAVLNLADVSVSAGMYKETLDMLESIDPGEIPQNLKSLYYGLLGRVFSEMAEYSNLAYYSEEYSEKAKFFREKALNYTEAGTFFHSFLQAFITLNDGEVEQALKMFNELLEQNLQPREKALVFYFLGDINERLNKKEQAIQYFAKAAIIDVETSTKETLAIIRLSELLFERDDLRYASAFIQKANEDADFYGAQHRKLQVGAILPLIEEKIIKRIEEQRERLYRQTLIVSFLLIFVFFLALVIYLQVRRLKSARKALLEAHENLQKINLQLTDVNEEIRRKNLELGRVNDQLLEANKIKEEYIGFFFTQDADIFEKFRSFKSKVEKDIADGSLEKAKYTLGSYDLKREKEKLLADFDEAFIKLFPNFIEEFNSLLKEEERITIKKGQLLNNELRIFALIRLGIRHNEIIAQILGYSVNSIYAYKTKIRKKSILDKTDFDQKLLENTTLQL
jgi:tetratricopeptide (TPR) repeat protein